MGALLGFFPLSSLDMQSLISAGWRDQNKRFEAIACAPIISGTEWVNGTTAYWIQLIHFRCTECCVCLSGGFSCSLCGETHQQQKNHAHLTIVQVIHLLTRSIGKLLDSRTDSQYYTLANTQIQSPLHITNVNNFRSKYSGAIVMFTQLPHPVLWTITIFLVNETHKLFVYRWYVYCKRVFSGQMLRR